MRTKCKVGDLAVITCEEPGLEENIARRVWVHKGPFLGADYVPVVVITPATEEPISSLWRDGSVSYERATSTYHPDQWMFPVWRSSPLKAQQTRAPLRNLPKLSREWTEAAMRGEA